MLIRQISIRASLFAVFGFCMFACAQEPAKMIAAIEGSKLVNSAGATLTLQEVMDRNHVPGIPFQMGTYFFLRLRTAPNRERTLLFFSG